MAPTKTARPAAVGMRGVGGKAAARGAARLTPLELSRHLFTCQKFSAVLKPESSKISVIYGQLDINGRPTTGAVFTQSQVAAEGAVS